MIFLPKRLTNWLKAPSKPTYINRRAYAAASQDNRYSDFTPVNLGPITAAPTPTLRQIRARAKDLQRNNEFASTGIQILASRLISKQGVQPRFMVKRGVTITESMIKNIRDRATLPEHIRWLLSEPKRKPAEKYEACVQALWEEFAENADFTGNHSFDDLVNIAVVSMIVNGESLIKRLTANKQVVPLQLQLIEADLINDNDDNFTDRFQGVNVTPIINRPVSISVYTNNPMGYNFLDVWTYIPMRDIVHLKHDDRPGQLRGVSWLATTMLTLRDLGKAQSSELTRMAVASLFVAVIEGGDKSRLPGATERDDSSGIMDAHMSPATFYHTREGETVTFSNPTSAVGFKDFTEINLRRVATGLMLPYYAISGDYANVNYSTSRMAETKSFELLNPIRQTTLVDNMMGKISQWFLEAIRLRGINDFGLKTVIPPMIETVVDAEKAIKITEAELGLGLISHSEAIRRSGRDPDAVRAQIIEDNKWAQDNDITFSIYGAATVEEVAEPEPEEDKPEDKPKDENID